VVGPKVSSELHRAGFLAVALASLAMLFYIWFRFEWQFAVGAVATLVLDVTKTVGFFALTGPLAEAGMIAPKPKTLDHVQAASVPVVAVTAWQMLFEYANLSAGELCLVHGAAGNVGSYAVQLAHQQGIRVVATASANDAEYLRELGANQVIDYRTVRFDDTVKDVDAVIDLVGGETADRSYGVLKPGGVMVSAVVFDLSQEKARHYGVRAVFMLVDVTNERLAKITNLLDSGRLKTSVASVLPLDRHTRCSMGPHERGKIVLKVAD
jgi:NADPH:quinone reductase-like Zn-dependent oxidoreductase